MNTPCKWIELYMCYRKTFYLLERKVLAYFPVYHVLKKKKKIKILSPNNCILNPKFHKRDVTFKHVHGFRSITVADCLIRVCLLRKIIGNVHHRKVKSTHHNSRAKFVGQSYLHEMFL